MAIAFLAICAFAAAAPVDAGDETCRAIPVTVYSPSGIAGCTLDGPTDGIASWYGGDVAAANWCTWPWDRCGSARVTSHLTGVTITVPVAQYCDCWWTSDRRLIDLTRGQVAALGLDPAHGTFAVTVEPIDHRSTSTGGADGSTADAVRPNPASAASPRMPDTAVAP